jgi:hypothetical protein
MSGWIKLHRSITDHWLYTEKRIFSKFEAWNDILLTVNFTETQCCIKGKVYTVKRGESILSFDSWGKRWGWDKSKVRRFFSLLKSDNMIELKSDNITTHLTVCKYDTYQDNGNTDETPKARKRNADEYQTTPIEERKKERKKEGKNNIEFIPPSLEEVYEYFKEKGHSQHTAQTAFYYYQNLNWFDSNDKKIVNWKNKMLSVWMKEETKIKPQSNQIVFPR